MLTLNKAGMLEHLEAPERPLRKRLGKRKPQKVVASGATGDRKLLQAVAAGTEEPWCGVPGHLFHQHADCLLHSQLKKCINFWINCPSSHFHLQPRRY